MTPTIDAMKTIRCYACKANKPTTEFYRVHANDPEKRCGWGTYCKQCQAVWQAAHRLKTKPRDRPDHNRVTYHGQRHHRAKLTEAQVRTIRERLAKNHTTAAIARDYNVTRTAISSIKHYYTWWRIT